MDQYEPPHLDLRCLQIQLFSSLVLKEFQYQYWGKSQIQLFLFQVLKELTMISVTFTLFSVFVMWADLGMPAILNPLSLAQSLLNSHPDIFIKETS